MFFKNCDILFFSFEIKDNDIGNDDGDDFDCNNNKDL